MSASLADLELLQRKTTQTLQQIDENFSRANDLATELVPLAREFIKHLVVADAESAVWHDAFLEVAGMRQAPPEESNASSSSSGQVEQTPARTPGKPSSDLDESDLVGSGLSSVAPGTRRTGGLRASALSASARRDGLTLFSPPVSTPFLKAARTPGHVAGYEAGGLDAQAAAAPSASTTPQLASSSSSSSSSGLALEDMDDAGDEAAAAAGSPDLASPEMPALSSRAAALLGALGSAPIAAADAATAAVATAGLRRSRLLTVPQSATAASSSSSSSALGGGGESGPASSPTAGAEVLARDLDSSVADDDDDDDDLDGLLAHLGSPGPIGLSRHSLAITSVIGPGGMPLDSANDAPSLEELTATAAAVGIRQAPAEAVGTAPLNTAAAVTGNDDDDDDDDLGMHPLTLSSLGGTSSSSSSSSSSGDSAAAQTPSLPPSLREERITTSRVAGRRKSTAGSAKHPDEFALHLFPALFHTGPPAANLIAVWAVVSGSSLDDEDSGSSSAPTAAWSAEDVVEALRKQAAGTDTAVPSQVKTAAILTMLASQGFLRQFESQGKRFWRLATM